MTDLHTAARTCCYIVPPHIVTAIAENGNARQRSRALRSLNRDASLRAVRVGRSAQLQGRRQLQRLSRPPQTGPQAWWRANAPGALDRTVYTARNRERLPGVEARGEGDPDTGDAAVDEAYRYVGLTADFFAEAYGRDSINDRGMPLVATVHYGEDYDNAFWDGEQMVYGDGDGELFNRFTIPLDVTGHELTHGVTEHEAGLIYWGQSGALNESVSDVFGSLVKQAVNDQKAGDADWLVGEGLLADGVDGTALRSMSAPGTAYDDRLLGKDPQPANMAQYVYTLEDNGGVHINSGIPNHAFYLAATAIGGYAWESAGRIWYETLRRRSLTPFAQFTDFARLTVAVARNLFGGASDESTAVGTAWKSVGVRI